MFGAIKRIFTRAQVAAPEPAAERMPAQGLVSPPTPRLRAFPAQTPLPPEPARRSRVPTDDRTVDVSFVDILSQVPSELYGKLAPAGAGDNSFPVALPQVLEQLAHGAVKVSFGELRQAAPPGLFIDASNHDNRMVSLPLQTILKQLPPDAYSRRPDQKILEVGTDVPDLFGPKGEGHTQVRILSKEELRPGSTASPASARTTETTHLSPARIRTAPPGGLAPRPQPTPPKPAPVHKISAATLPRPYSLAPAATPQSPSQKSTPLPKAVIPQPRPAAPQKISAATLPPSASLGRTAAAPTPPMRPAPVRPAPATKPLEDRLAVPLGDLAAEWPEPVRQEIEALGIADAQCVLPMAEVGDALKHGKLEYSWQTLISWTLPPPSQPGSSELEDTVLDLPLNLIVPLYLARIKGSVTGRKAKTADSAPAVFTKVGTPNKPVPAATEPARVPASRPEAPNRPAAPVSPPPAAPVSAPAVPASPPAAKSGTGAGTLSLNLPTICANWPEPVRREIELLSLDALPVEIPLEVIEGGMRLGKVEFTWQQVCAWVQGCPPSVPAPATAETRLQLPLNVLAPLFIKHRPQRQARQSAALAEIPDVFNHTPPAPPAPQASPAPPAPAVSAQPAAPAVQAPPAKKPPEDIAELFGEPDKRNWTPNEIVQRTSGLPGVAGALITLQDGLLVAQCLPPSLKADTIAAFLPQIYGRMNQYSKEFGMGELKNFTLVMGDGILQIFNAGIIYFAVLGRTGVPLPQLELNIIVNELSRHTK